MSNERNLIEGNCKFEVVPANFPLTVQAPPVMRGERRKDTSGLRTASPGRQQGVVILPDISASMDKDYKWKYQNEAVQEVIARMKTKNPRLSSWIVSIHPFGDHFITEEEFTLKPCLEVDEDRIHNRGDGGGTKMRNAVKHAAKIIKVFDDQYLRLHEEPERCPPPLLIILTDGYSGDGDPSEMCERIANTNLSIGIPPLIITIGIEFGGGEPNVAMLQRMASKTSDGRPLYFDISEASMLAEFLAVLSSSSASTADEVVEQADDVKAGWANFGEED